uniref:Uncharacterized protein n=1 Tax=Knipowitschia caucasica TaxID=637954 RepID=A0AAV2JN93_KNICA
MRSTALALQSKHWAASAFVQLQPLFPKRTVSSTKQDCTVTSGHLA